MVYLAQCKQSPHTDVAEITTYLETLKFTDDELNKLEQYLNQKDLDEVTQRQLKYYNNNAHQSNQKIDSWIKKLSNSDGIDTIQLEMANFIKSMGIPTEVIADPIQTF